MPKDQQRDTPMPTYTVKVNRALPRDGNGDVYHIVNTQILAGDRDPNVKAGWTCLIVKESDPRAQVAEGKQFTVSPVEVIP